MKKILTSLAIIVSALTSAQVYVGTGGHMYVNNQVLFVKQDISLQNNGAIYLRNESQLLQGTTDVSTNTGTGKLSVFQEGTSDHFDYNYWCSPVGNLDGSGNGPFGITMLGSPATVSTSNPAVILSNSMLDGTAAPLSIAPRWVFKYLSGSDYAQWIPVGSATTINPGEGFTMKGTSGTDAVLVNGVTNNPGGAQRYDFRGKPNDGNISVGVGLDHMTLTGNPYPSALHMNAFLLDPDNSACDGIAYYWEQDKTTNSHILTQYRGGYGTYSPLSLGSNGIYAPATFNAYDNLGNLNNTGTSSGLSINRKYAPIGQGFMVKGTANGMLTLKNTHRSYYKESGALSEFERRADAENGLSYFRINAILNNTFTRQLVLTFLPEATDGIDRGIDAPSPDNSLPSDVYFPIEDQKFVIQGLPFAVHKTIPLGIRAVQNATFRFYIPETVHFDDMAIFIHDLLDDSYHNIQNGFYDLTLDAGTYDNRFELAFAPDVLGTTENELQTVGIYQNNDTQTLTISNKNNPSPDLQQCRVYDMRGKLVMQQDLTSAKAYCFSTEALEPGIYMVKVTTVTQETIVKKIAVF